VLGSSLQPDRVSIVVPTEEHRYTELKLATRIFVDTPFPLSYKRNTTLN